MDACISAVNLIEKDYWCMHCLAAVLDIGLPDCFIVAGFVRNLIWDHQHGYTVRTELNDVDVAFFNALDLSEDIELDAETRLKRIDSTVRWQVRNQARMHLHNKHVPYASTVDAIGFYPEIETCIGASLTREGKVHISAPYGIDRNWELKIRRNPKPGYSQGIIERRIEEKRWLERWPDLKIAEWKGVASSIV